MAFTDGGDGPPAAGGPDGHLGLMRRVAVAMFLLGAAVCASGVITTETTAFARIFQGSVAAAYALCGLVLVALPPRRRVIEASVLLSVVLLTGLVAASHPIGMAPFFYLWPVVFTAYFCSQRMLVATFALMAASLLTGLALNTTSFPKVDMYVGTVASVGMMAALVAAMNRREVRLRRELASAADTDPLTGLLNRRAFNPELAAVARRARHEGTPLSLVMFDLDHFKRFNDHHGHFAGDEGLRRLAALLREHARPGDLVARFGGEEFAVALPATDVIGARSYALRIACALNEEAVDAAMRLSTSAGISSLVAGHDDLDALLLGADEALYAAKAAGRSRVAWWDGTLHVGDPIGEPDGPGARTPSAASAASAAKDDARLPERAASQLGSTA